MTTRNAELRIKLLLYLDLSLNTLSDNILI
jgi:hypothetical protein